MAGRPLFPITKTSAAAATTTDRRREEKTTAGALGVWKILSSLSMPEKFLPQLLYNERSQRGEG
jgi:hypothetical protein